MSITCFVVFKIFCSLYCNYAGQSTASAFDYLREASIVGGWDMTIRSGPVPEAKLLAVGEQPMVGLYRISKVHLVHLNMMEPV